MSRKAVICMPSYRATNGDLFSDVLPYLLAKGWHKPRGVGFGSNVMTNRTRLANHFLSAPECAGFDWSFWCDDDMLVLRHAPVQLLIEAEREGRKVLQICAVPGQHNTRTLACSPAEFDTDDAGNPVWWFGADRGRHYRCHRIGMGITAIHRSVFEELTQYALKSIIASPRDGDEIEGWEFFPEGSHTQRRCKWCRHYTASGCEYLGRVVERWNYCCGWEPDAEKHRARNHGEDYGFAALCDLAGIPIHVTTTMRCWHYHPYPYSIEDAFRSITRAQGDFMVKM
jgi:hypothetical protein